MRNILIIKMDYEISLELLKQLEENYKIYIVKEAGNLFKIMIGTACRL